MKHILTILFFVFSFSVIAQQSKVDSLEILLKSAPQDSNKVILLNKLFPLLNLSSPDKAEAYAKLSLEILKPTSSRSVNLPTANLLRITQ